MGVISLNHAIEGEDAEFILIASGEFTRKLDKYNETQDQILCLLFWKNRV